MNRILQKLRSRDEHGGTLILVLVFVCVMSVTYLATLDLINVTYRAQTTLAAKVEIDEEAENAVDIAIQKILAEQDENALFGVDAAGPTSQCNNTAFDLNSSEPFYTQSELIIYCNPEPHSGRVAPEQLDYALPEYTIVTLGGVDGPGNATGAQGDYRDHLPFCDNWHARQFEANLSCEAGIFIGNTPADGIQIGSSGDPDGRIMYSNSSIVVENNNKISIEGAVEARRSCVGNILAGVGQGDAPPDGWLNCQNTSAALRTVADYAYEPQPVPDVGDPVARTVPGTPECDDGYVPFEPGRYENLTALNQLMNAPACIGAVFHFKPGAYYFDFVGPEPHKWVEPFSTGAGDVPAHIIGGAIPPEGNPNHWVPCNGTCPVQPPHEMRFNRKTSSGTWTNVDESNVIDSEATDQTNAAFIQAGTATRNIEWDDPEARIPEMAGTKVERFAVRISQRIPTDPGLIQDGYPRLVIGWDGGATNASGSCTVTLDRPREVFATQEIVLFDAASNTNTCPGNAVNNYNQKLGILADNPKWMNHVTLKYEVRSKVDSAKVSVYLDGVAQVVTYEGRPTPPFPDGCDATVSGVQFIFGNTSRMEFDGNSAYTELCGMYGHRAGRRGDNLPIAIFGLEEGVATHPRTSEVTRTGANGVSTDGVTVWPVQSQDRVGWHRPNGGDARLITTLDDEPPSDMWQTMPWTTNSATSIDIALPANLIPANSTVTGVEIKVRHRETHEDGKNVGTITMSVIPKGAGGPAWSTNVPVCKSDLDPCTWDFGGFNDPSDPSMPRADWRLHRSAFDRLDTADKWNEATIRWELIEPDPGEKHAYLDAVQIKVHYRPPYALRPLRGCLTVRSRHSPHANGYTTADGYSAGDNPTRPPLAGTDYDWAPASDALTTDRTYTTGLQSDDTGDCALLRLISDKTPGQKFRVNGMIYAPTAALDLSGHDNEGPFVTQGLISRHLTLWRWDGGCVAGTCGYEPNVVCNNREVVLRAFYDGVEVRRTEVEIDDDQCEQWGQSATVKRVVMRPRSDP